MKLVVDMCLPPDLAASLVTAGHEAVHWSIIGDPQAMDIAIMEWAKRNGSVIVTHDLDLAISYSPPRTMRQVSSLFGRRIPM